MEIGDILTLSDLQLHGVNNKLQTNIILDALSKLFICALIMYLCSIYWSRF